MDGKRGDYVSRNGVGEIGAEDYIRVRGQGHHREVSAGRLQRRT